MELKAGAPSPFLEVLIRPAAAAPVSGFSPGAIARSGDGRTQYFGMTLRRLLAYAEEVTEDRVRVPEWLTHARYDLEIAVPQGRDELRRSLMREALVTVFELHLRREKHTASVYVLSKDPNSPAKLVSSHAKAAERLVSQPGRLSAIAAPMPALIEALRRELGGPEIIDETELNGLYDLDLTWAGGAEALQAGLAEQLGLTLARKTREREFIVVTAGEQPKTWAAASVLNAKGRSP